MSVSTRLENTYRLIQTVRHLRFKQIIFQLWFRVYRGVMPPVPEFTLRNLKPINTWVQKPACWEPGVAFTFIGERREHQPSVQWEQSGAAKLWLYNLHYFDCLGAQAAITSSTSSTALSSPDAYQQQCAALIDDWTNNNQTIAGNGWEPYPASLRIVNWIKWHAQVGALHKVALASLAQQVQRLASRLEYHILANHLFANAKALVFAGLFFEGECAAKWLAKGVSLVSTELDEQILADGAHFELSPMYHAILLEDVLDMINLAGAANGAISAHTLSHWRQTAQLMLQWQATMLHPDGELAFFNDAALGIARNPSQIEAYATTLGISRDKKNDPLLESKYLRSSGYGVLVKGEFKVLADVASVGPSYQPGHAHADTLSCEISYGSERIFVNAGTSTYMKGTLRDQQRSTAAHNTLELAGQNSSGVWDGFRVANRAHPKDVVWTGDDKHTHLRASHNGYRFLPGKPVHSREWLLTEQGLEVTDQIQSVGLEAAQQGHMAVVRWLLHPSVELLGSNRLRTASANELEWLVTGAETEIQPAFWYPQFGAEVATQCIVVRRRVDANFNVKFHLQAQPT